jgi:hypothetical protein
MNLGRRRVLVNGIKLRADSLQEIALGESAAPISLTSESRKLLEVHSTQSSTSAGTSFEPFLVSTELTGAGQVGGRGRFYTKANVALGGWANALKAEIDFETSGRVTGLGSALVAEMTLPGATLSTGTYGVIEAELNCPASWAGTVPVSFLYLSAQGSTVGNFDDNGFLLDLAGVSAGGAHLYATGNAQAGNISGTLRVRVDGTTHYITLYDAAATTE